jgi:hypothetical protein
MYRPYNAGYAGLQSFYLYPSQYYENEMNKAISPFAIEWGAYINKEVSVNYIDSILTKCPPDLYFLSVEMGRVDSLTAALTRKNSDAAKYLNLSKQLEAIDADYEQWWNDKLGDGREEKLKALKLEVQQYLNQKQDAFMKRKWTFLMFRLLNELYDTEAMFALYESDMKHLSNDNAEKARCEIYMADNSEGIERAIHCARAFNASADRQQRAVELFDDSLFNSAYQSTKDVQEKCALIVLANINNPGRALGTIQNIAQLDINYKYLDFMITREINKVENWMLSYEYTGNLAIATEEDWADIWNADSYGKRKMLVAKFFSKNVNYAQQLKSTIYKLSDYSTGERKALLLAGAANLAFLLKKNDEAKSTLAKAKNELSNGSKVKAQIAIQELAITIQSKAKWDSDIEDLFVKNDAVIQEGLDGVFDGKDALSALYNYVGWWCVRHERCDLSYFFFMKTTKVYDKVFDDFSTSPDDILLAMGTPQEVDNLVSLVKKENTTPFEKWIKGNGMFSRCYYCEEFDINNEKDALLKLEAILYFRMDDFESAIRVLENVSPDFWNTPEESFDRYDPFHFSVYRSDRKHKKFNMLEFAREMNRLKRAKSTNPEEEANRCFALANGYYYLTYYGDGWDYMNNTKSYSPYPLLSRVTNMNDVWLGCSRAKEYYELALKYTEDKDLAYACAVRMVNCDGVKYKESSAYRALKSKGFETAEWLSCESHCENMIHFVSRANSRIPGF